MPESFIDKFVEEKKSWIEQTILKIEKSKTKLNINEIFFLGKVRKLNFSSIESIDEDSVTIKTSGSTSLEKKNQLENFLKIQTKIFVEKYLGKYNHLHYKSVKYRLYSSKWGSCSPKDELTFNIKLAMCPEEVIEYIVVHELCHTLQKNHSSRFWNEVCKLLPSYKEQRSWLRKNKWAL